MVEITVKSSDPDVLAYNVAVWALQILTRENLLYLDLVKTHSPKVKL